MQVLTLTSELRKKYQKNGSVLLKIYRQIVEKVKFLSKNMEKSLQKNWRQICGKMMCAGKKKLPLAEKSVPI